MVRVLRKHPLKGMLAGDKWWGVGKDPLLLDLFSIPPLWSTSFILCEGELQTLSPLGAGEKLLQLGRKIETINLLNLKKSRSIKKAVKTHETQR